MTGNVFQLPSDWIVAESVFEYRPRRPRIDSGPRRTRRALHRLFRRCGAIGDKYTRGVLREIEIPVIAGQPAAKSWCSTSRRDGPTTSSDGGAWTHSYKMAYRRSTRCCSGPPPARPIARRICRELHRAADRVSHVFDPCLIPGRALDELTGAYVPESDDRDQTVLDNCRANGVDPTIANNNGNNTFSVEVGAGGTMDLGEERSRNPCPPVSPSNNRSPTPSIFRPHELLRNRRRGFDHRALTRDISSTTATIPPAASARSARVSSATRTPSSRSSTTSIGASSTATAKSTGAWT